MRRAAAGGDGGGASNSVVLAQRSRPMAGVAGRRKRVRRASRAGFNGVIPTGLQAVVREVGGPLTFNGSTSTVVTFDAAVLNVVAGTGTAGEVLPADPVFATAPNYLGVNACFVTPWLFKQHTSFAHIFEECAIQRLIFNFVPMQSTATTGLLAAYVDPNFRNGHSELPVTSGHPDFTKASGRSGNIRFSPWVQTVIPYQQLDPLERSSFRTDLAWDAAPDLAPYASRSDETASHMLYFIGVGLPATVTTVGMVWCTATMRYSRLKNV